MFVAHAFIFIASHGQRVATTTFNLKLSQKEKGLRNTFVACAAW